MANARKASSPEENEIIAGQNEWDVHLPESHPERVALIDKLNRVRQGVNDKIAQIKKDAGLSDLEANLIGQNGYTPQALKIMAILDGMPARSRAKTIRQVNGRSEDKGWILPDMFDQASASVRGEAAREPAAEQRSPEAMAASHETPGADPLEVKLTSAEARTALEDYLKDHPRKRGAKPKELTRLEEQLEAALAREGAEPDNVVKLGGQMRGTADAGEAHIKAQIAEQEKGKAKEGQAATAEQPAQADPAPETKAKRTRAKKETPAPEPQAKSGPPSVDDDEEDAPAAPSGPIGTTSPSFSMS